MTIDTLGILTAGRLERSLVPQGVSHATRTPAAVTAPATTTPATPAGPATTPARDTKDSIGATDALKDAVSKLNESIHAQSLEFSIDEDSKRTVVKVIDSATREVVRQMPTEEALQIAKSLDKAFSLLPRQQA